jgi:hypothetical protein
MLTARTNRAAVLVLETAVAVVVAVAVVGGVFAYWLAVAGKL